jgi:hypothetical protein
MQRERRFGAKNVPTGPFACSCPGFAAGKVGRGIVGGVEGFASGAMKGFKGSVEQKKS